MDDDTTAVTDIAALDVPVSENAVDCIVPIYGEAGLPLGRPIRLRGTEIRIGRSRDNDVVLQDDRVSRAHARLEERGSRWVICDEESNNGTFVNRRKLQGYVELGLNDRIQIGTTIFKFLTGNDVEAATHEAVYQLTITDELTGLPNRRALDAELEREFVRTRRCGRTFSVLMLDIDHFKKVNDSYGHPAGDAVLVEIASVIQSQTRETDLVGRCGGEEIAVVVVEASLGEAASLAERIRAAVESHIFKYDGKVIPVTVSIGGAELSQGDGAASDLVRRADDKLYQAKCAGRNRIAV